MPEAKRGRSRPGKKRAAAKAKNGVMALRHVPSPRPAARGESLVQPSAPSGGTRAVKKLPGALGEIDLEQVEALAACGLTLEQIAVELGIVGAPRPSLRVRMEAAIKRGRAIGSAKLKRAHYQAALKGSVSAQKEMLALLEDELEDDDPVVVEEVILHDPEEGDGTEEAQD